MKKLSVLFLALLIMLCGCAAEKAPVNCLEAANAIKASCGFQELDEMSRSYITKYLGIDDALLADAVMLRDASRATPEMILLLTAAKQGDVKALETAVSDFHSTQLEEYRDYQPDEMPKLENAKVTVNGRMIALIVSPDADKTDAALKTAWNK
ncbi:MAG: DUF4358 domain-containing protein [Eubacteriales bacterium]|nr:DUF4358 domain-containing protein [Eubacteriales bacterium]MDD3881593.1 DUF4358 domain-containing protein [Eubacteriales bacterium]MDD4512348.1 DUF4358 domain-containing protein [Eubacteriales bacterium]